MESKASPSSGSDALVVFSQAWADRWAAELRRSKAYRQAAAAWEGALQLVLAASSAEGVEEPRAVWADLWHGECRAVHAGDPGTLPEAPYVLEGDLEVWRRVLAGELAALWAVASGKLRLQRGSLLKLTPYARAAQELVAAAARVPTRFPDEPEASAPPPTAPPPTAAPPSRVYQTTSVRGLDSSHPALRLWQKAKRRGIWNPSDLDMTRDRSDWQVLTPEERDLLLRLTSLFQAGEEAVTLDLLPLIQTVAAEGRLEEEIYLTSFLWEEAKHVEFFRRFLDEVAGESGDLSRYHTPSYRTLFYDELPGALGRLRQDPSPVAQAEASVTYNMIVEGVLAETGYHAYFTILERQDLMPGVRQGVAHLKSDESRHLAYGVFLLSRLVVEHGDSIWQAIDGRMGTLLGPALGIIEEMFAAYPTMPFGLQLEEFTQYALSQFQRRLDRIGQARTQTLPQLLIQKPEKW